MRRLSTGRTTIACRNCQTVDFIRNEKLEEMTGFRCKGCGVPMTEARFAKMKISYYEKMYHALTTPPYGGEGPEMFKVKVDFAPHFE